MTKQHVESLIAKAAEAADSGDAMRFTQAANNAANAMLALDALQPATQTDAVVRHRLGSD